MSAGGPAPAALARWSRIALVRELSSAAAADGGALGSKFGSKFARQARESAAERQKRYQQKCQIIFDRQARPEPGGVVCPWPLGCLVAPSTSALAAEMPAFKETAVM
jgi:hypothetical protein